MLLKDFLQGISNEIKATNDSDFKIEVIETKLVPSKDDRDITYENYDSNIKKVKLIETCVLYIDIRKSTNLSLAHQPKTLSKLYSSFVKSMVRCARHYGGHVRNIIGDRVMVVFDTENCFTDAVNTAILMNTVSSKLLNKHFKHNEVECGIGIDYGKMLVTKVGTVVKGMDNPEYKSLVWLGKPANIASKLTDVANKKCDNRKSHAISSNYYPLTKQWHHQRVSPSEFINRLTPLYKESLLKHNDEYFVTVSNHVEGELFSAKPILMTEAVYLGFKQANPLDKSIENNWWHEQKLDIQNYSGKVYGGSVYFKVVDEVN